MPSTSKAAASAPSKEMLLLPRASSLMAMSATLMRLLVLVFSAREAVTLLRATADGASLTRRSWLPKSRPVSTWPGTRLTVCVKLKVLGSVDVPPPEFADGLTPLVGTELGSRLRICSANR